MEVLVIFMGLISGFVFASILVIGAFMIIFPIYASSGLFVNKPEGLLKSGFHVFTTLESGQIKILERGKKFVRMITNTPDTQYARIGARDSSGYWKLIPVPGMSKDPVAEVWLPIRWWAKIVYEKTGLVFTGIYPFQKVREYELERTAVERKESTKKPDDAESNLALIVKHDVSDHFRTREFLFPMHITAAETADKIPLDIIGVAEMSVVDAYKAAYGTDRWDQKVINLVTDAITSETKKMKLDQALTASDSADANKIQNAVIAIKDDTEVCGIEISGFKILEINPILDSEGLAAIRAEAIASQKAKATRIDGEARADALRKLNEANKAGGEHSVATMEAEAFVRAAEAAGKNGGSVILMPGNRSGANMDPTLTAILTELKQLNKSKGA